MNAAGYILTGMRKCRRRAHAPMILAHSLTSEFFGIEEREGYFPDFESFSVWPATARLLWELRDLDRPELAGQSSLAHFGHWRDPIRRQFIICHPKEAKRARAQAKSLTLKSYNGNKLACGQIHLVTR
jgi:hypothetical protein